jgi:hypothetical protein
MTVIRPCPRRHVAWTSRGKRRPSALLHPKRFAGLGQFRGAVLQFLLSAFGCCLLGFDLPMFVCNLGQVFGFVSVVGILDRLAEVLDRDFTVVLVASPRC